VNAPASIQSSQAAADATRWRGQCVDYYAQIEFLVASSLRKLKDDGRELPFTYRAKIAGLREALNNKQSRLFGTLDQLHADCERRNLIVHACGSVALTPVGDWTWTGSYIPSGEDNKIVAKAITRPEADSLEEDLRRTVQSLKQQLASLKKEAVAK
jgi:hypothetical protein